MNAIELLKSQVNMAHTFLDGTCADVSREQADGLPGGKAHPIGATMAHIVLAEDIVISMFARGAQPLVMGEWSGKTGVSEPEPMDRSEENLLAWANRVQVDIPQLQQYGKAVLKNTLDWVDSLTEADLDRELNPPGFGKQTVASMISLAALVHVSNHCGEVSALKGIQGAKGYPF
jgi:uncharacterized damage-inducible protein DinB